MANVFRSLNLLFDRPNEPLIYPKGETETVFQVSEQFLDKDYQNNGIEINNRFGEKATDLIPLKNLNKLPEFPKASKLPKDSEFSLFLPSHQEMAKEVMEVLLAVPENQLQDLLSTCAYSRMHLNPQLFNYCFSVALMHRQDTKNVQLQNHVETFPSKFMNSQVFGQARETAALQAKGSPRIPIIIPRDFTATDLDVEHRLAYFREDIGVNLHHWHWHLVYPFSAPRREMVAKDRRGELFLYMHQQIIARYNGERLNNMLPRVKKFSNWSEAIPEAYYPKLDNLTTSRGWPPRQAGMKWQDLDRPVDNLKLTVGDMMRWRRNVEDAISTGFVILPDGSTQPLDADTLGNMVEASILSPNPELYGALHNNGHNFTAYIHDPQHRYLESTSVMADEATTMRDPFFYRWHAFVDDLYQKFKESESVTRYTRSQLDNPGVQIANVRVVSDSGPDNTLNTFWMQSDVELSKGLDFSERGSVLARFTHLNHRNFRYEIDVMNSGEARLTTVRIFMAPSVDERNLPWILNDQRKMFIEMDKFVTTLNAGPNKIIRSSMESSVTIPFEQTFRDLSRPNDQTTGELTSTSFCGCGWPQHMLVPKGTEAGAQHDLFVMLSNYDLDSVNNPDGSQMTCKEASSYCGLKDRLYPDRRSMGFPFDRPSRNAANLQDFLLPNMFKQDIRIVLQNTPVEINPRNPRN
ncbi:phenoloxidase subunit 2-like [Danaus plexippus]|uniref:phenoloxidase subunit 2-like n=1 Tax=Danaus plexippus TaxID=13037 RepID=UPI002AAF6EC6|nr:phenoloxidase subunit 2-like [Danaus plexippus]